MRLIFIGAGPIGSLYAARLALAGHEVSLVARGERLARLRGRGLVLVGGAKGREERAHVSVVDAAELDSSAFGLRAESCDAAFLAVRAERIAQALPDLAAFSGARRLVLFANQADGGASAAAFLGPERCILGFPGATASIDADGRVVYGVVPAFAQRTSFGLPRQARDAGGQGRRLAAELVRACAGAGFPSALSSDMEAWLATHAAFIGPVGAALLASGCLEALAADPGLSALLVDAVREGLSSLRGSGRRIEPPKLGFLLSAPRGFVLAALPLVLRSKAMRASIGGHASVSALEMLLLLGSTIERRRGLGLPSPANEELSRRIDR